MSVSERPAATSPRTWKAGTLTYTLPSLAGLFAWLLWGDFAWALKERAVGPIVQIMLGQFEASSTLIGFLIGTLPAAVNMVLGPVVSYLSDRHRGPWGRRIPFLLAPTPIAALALIGLAFCAYLGSGLHSLLGAFSPGLNQSRLVCFAILWGLFEVATVTANAVYSGLINDVVPSTVLGRFYGLFRTISLAVGVGFNFWLMAHVEQHYQWIFVTVGIMYGVGFALMCLKVKEGQYEPAPPAAPDPRFRLAARTYLRECFSNGYYRWFFVAYAIAALAQLPFNTFMIPYAKSIHLSIGEVGVIIAVSMAISFAIAYVIGALADRFHPLRVGMVAAFLYAVFGAWAGVYADNVPAFSLAIGLHVVLSAAWMTSTMSLPLRIFPQSRFAQFNAAAGIVGAALTMLVSPMAGVILDMTGNVYRFTFLMGGTLAAVGFLCLLEFHRRFTRHGGIANYVPPN